MIATAKELRIKTRQLLDAVERGEEVIVTHRGRACAKLVPVSRASKAGARVRNAPLFGMWKDYKAAQDVDGYIDQIRRPRV